MEYSLYRGYILHVLVAQTSIFGTMLQAQQGSPVHRSWSEEEAMFWVDGEVTMGGYGTATQADVDELNQQAESVVLPLPAILTPDFLESLRFCVSAAEADGAIGAEARDEYMKKLDGVARALGYIIDYANPIHRYM